MRERGSAGEATIGPAAEFEGSKCVAPGGGVTNFRFPTPVPTAQAMNRAVGALSKRLDRVQGKAVQQASASGLAILAVSGGLTVWGAAKTLEAKEGWPQWANRDSTMAAAGISAMQIAYSAATWAVTGRYQRSFSSNAANAFAAAQLAAFAFGKLYTPTPDGAGARHHVELLSKLEGSPSGYDLTKLDPGTLAMKTGGDDHLYEVVDISTLETPNARALVRARLGV